MTRFHINAKGEAGPCRAINGNCPFGSVEDHFDSLEDARSAYEERAAAEFTPVNSLKRSAAPAKPSLFNNEAARNLVGQLSGGKTYEKTIADARERASLASDYFAKTKLPANSTIDFALHTEPASAETRVDALAALQARRASGGSNINLSSVAPASTVAKADALSALQARRSARNPFLAGAKNYAAMV